MITFDAEYSVIVHFEVSDETALKYGGINMETAKKNCGQLSDWILSAISNSIEISDSDTVTVIPVEEKLMFNDKRIDIPKTANEYDVTLSDGSIVNFETEEIKQGENNENEI